MANTQIYLSNLQSSPNHAKYKNYHWADYLELVCLVNVDGEVSKSDFVRRLSPNQNDLREGDIDDIDEMEDLENEDGHLSTERSTKSDKWKVQLDDWFLLLEHRQIIYGDYYPFKLDNDTILLKDNFTSEQLCYFYLLFSSNLNLFEDSDSLKLSANFESLCLNVLKNILPSNAEVHLFGKSPVNGGIFTGKVWDKLELLSKKLNEDMNPKINKSAYPHQNTGDDGIDTVAWVPTGDDLPSKMVYFGQCTCSADGWVLKQHSSSYSSISNKMSLMTFTNNILFIPFCYRSNTGMWFNTGDIAKTLMVDRKRLLHYLYDDFTTFEKLEVFQMVKSIVAVKEEIN
ncbi:MAG: hypothetical protein EOO20_05050 [Chryseobacterium sp.]|nr:MAG: hypothetical protein EOO20_05050 [Chryseobacterium sp.]